MPTEGWTETAVRFMPDYALALPPGLVEDTTARFMHGGRRWQGPDSLVVNEMYGMWSETSFADPDTVAAHGGRLATCTVRSGPVRTVLVATAWPDARYDASAWMRDTTAGPPRTSAPRGALDVVLGAHGRSDAAVRTLLSIVQGVRKR